MRRLEKLKSALIVSVTQNYLAWGKKERSIAKWKTKGELSNVRILSKAMPRCCLPDVFLVMVTSESTAARQRSRLLT